MDSELQIGLLALGVAAVVGIIAYNKWQERKHRKHAEHAFRSDHPDVLLEAPKRWRNGTERVEPRADENNEAGEPAAAPISPPASRPTAQTSGRLSSPGLPPAIDTRVDCAIRIESIEPLDTPRLWAAQHELLNGVSKAVRWFAFDDRENIWRGLTPHSAGAHHWFCAAMQMVDRRGAISELEYQSFSDGVQRVADQFLAVPADSPARALVLSGAADMDRFCASVDVQVGVNIVCNDEPFPGTKLRALAEAGGMQLADDGAFHALDDEGRSLFMLCNLEAGLFSPTAMRSLHTRGVTLIIDVPLVADGVGTFDRMMRQANQMADSLNGSVVDDNRAPFGGDSAALIRAQIHQFQTQMAANGIPAGGPLATRLFSA